MPAPRRYPGELRDRAVRMVCEDGEHGATARVADRLDRNREPLRCWVKADRRRGGHGGAWAGLNLATRAASSYPGWESPRSFQAS